MRRASMPSTAAEETAASSISRTVLRNSVGDRLAVCSSLTDVTEQRRIEAQLRQSQRLEAVGH